MTLWGGYKEGGETWAQDTHLITSSGEERPALQWLKQYFSSSGETGAYANFESGLDGWSGTNLNAGPWSTDAWSSKDLRSLQGDINMSSGDQHYLSKKGHFSFAGNELRATVKGASWG